MARRGPALPPTALAVGVPTAAFLATAGPAGYWLDSGTFVAQAADLGIAHPPGHPLAGILTSAMAMVPLGSLSFRVALASALCAGFAVFFLHRATWRTLRSLGVAPRLVDPVSLATAWWVAASFGWWMQAVRPEVYALQALLAMAIIDQLIAFEISWPDAPDARPVLAAALCFGLGLANHHLLALLLLPAAASTLARVVQTAGFGSLGRVVGASALGAATYAYLPLRALSSPLSNLGDPSNADRFWWVVSAEAFQKNQGAGVPDPLPLRFADVVMLLAESLHWGVLLAALGGVYVVLRVDSARRIGAIWIVVLGVFVMARAWLGFVSGNPDALGYLMPALAAAGVLGACLIATVLQLLPTSMSRVTTALGVAIAIGSGGQLVRTGSDASMAAFYDADLFDGAQLRDLPPRSVVIAHAPQSIFRMNGLRAEEAARPDVTVVPVPLLTYPGMVDDLLEEEPDLRELLRGALVSGELNQPDVQSLAHQRPLLLEMDPRVPFALYTSLVPSGFYHVVIPGGATSADIDEGSDAQRKLWQGVLTRLRWGALSGQAAREQVLWRRAQDAIYLSAVGRRVDARTAVRTTLEASPGERSMVWLQEALDAPNADGLAEGPVDVRPLLVDFR